MAAIRSCTFSCCCEGNTMKAESSRKFALLNQRTVAACFGAPHEVSKSSLIKLPLLFGKEWAGTPFALGVVITSHVACSAGMAGPVKHECSHTKLQAARAGA
eukprot:6160197-Pleurochrysis_carterae.AAC.2